MHTGFVPFDVRPPVPNDRDLSDAELLGAYRYQPNLEQRHHQLKTVMAPHRWS